VKAQATGEIDLLYVADGLLFFLRNQERPWRRQLFTTKFRITWCSDFLKRKIDKAFRFFNLFLFPRETGETMHTTTHARGREQFASHYSSNGCGRTKH
jgi:hypothetical protein